MLCTKVRSLICRSEPISASAPLESRAEEECQNWKQSSPLIFSCKGELKRLATASIAGTQITEIVWVPKYLQNDMNFESASFLHKLLWQALSLHFSVETKKRDKKEKELGIHTRIFGALLMLLEALYVMCSGYLSEKCPRVAPSRGSYRVCTHCLYTSQCSMEYICIRNGLIAQQLPVS